jgi:hypothetical protein
MNISPTFEPVSLMRTTAALLAQHAIDDGVDVQTLVENVIDNRDMVVTASYDGVSFLRICMEVFRQQAIGRPRPQVELLIGAVKVIKPIYYAKLHEAD